MAIDFEMTPRQRKLKDDAREFAREVLRPVTERADAIADPQEAFVAMKPAFDGTNTDFLGGWVVSERGGTANFDHPNPMAGIQLIAEPDKCWKAGHYLDLHERGGHALMADPGFTPDLFVDCEPFDFKKSMEGFGVGVEIR
jgi:hypothetical protein